MSIMLGNLSVSQIEERLGIEFPEDTRELMKNTHESNASHVPNGKWHCFDIPFNLVCGDIDIATKIFNSVKDQSDKCKCALEFSIQGGN